MSARDGPHWPRLDVARLERAAVRAARRWPGLAAKVERRGEAWASCRFEAPRPLALAWELAAASGDELHVRPVEPRASAALAAQWAARGHAPSWPVVLELQVAPATRLPGLGCELSFAAAQADNALCPALLPRLCEALAEALGEGLDGDPPAAGR